VLGDDFYSRFTPPPALSACGHAQAGGRQVKNQSRIPLEVT